MYYDADNCAQILISWDNFRYTFFQIKKGIKMLKTTLSITLVVIFVGCSSSQPKATSSKCQKIESELVSLKSHKYSEYVAMVATTSYSQGGSENNLKERIKVLEMKLKTCEE